MRILCSDIDHIQERNRHPIKGQWKMKTLRTDVAGQSRTDLDYNSSLEEPSDMMFWRVLLLVEQGEDLISLKHSTGLLQYVQSYSLRDVSLILFSLFADLTEC
jgi:hypothetical protein